MSKEKKPTVTAGRKGQYQRYKDGKRLEVNQRKRAARLRKAADKRSKRIMAGKVTLRGTARALRRIKQGVTEVRHSTAVIERLQINWSAANDAVKAAA